MDESGVARATEDIAAAWLREGRRFVQALLVEVEGSAPLPEGAMMLVGDSGEIEGSITGGCVEGALVAEAERILAGERGAGIETYGISDELAGTVGLMCGGIVHIFLQELSGARDPAGAAELAALRAHLDGRPAAVATLLEGERAGGRLAVVDGEPVGSLGPLPLLDRNVAREAAGLMEEGKTTIRRYGVDGATLGDELPVHVRAYAPPPQMVIFGAIDFSAALAAFASRIGYRVAICDARDRFARSGRFSADAEVRIGWPQELIDGFELGPRDAVLVFTHDPKFDEPALIGALGTGAGYIGALGSRTTTADRERRLRDAGVSDADLARVHAPCGLDIGSRTAEETAISVLAEIIAVRRRGPALDARPLRATSGPIHGRDQDRSASAVR
ncbi:MAG TPA: XdhC family protein [Solirubrobacteraceae bacterium]|nr:XdhC family protein [Solirubrobacteraceae bacterium]